VKRPLSSLLPLWVAAVSLAITFGLWHHERQGDTAQLRTSFDFALRQSATRIEQRMASYEQMLRGVQGLFAASGNHVERANFNAYVDALLAVVAGRQGQHVAAAARMARQLGVRAAAAAAAARRAVAAVVLTAGAAVGTPIAGRAARAARAARTARAAGAAPARASRRAGRAARAARAAPARAAAGAADRAARACRAAARAAY